MRILRDKRIMVKELVYKFWKMLVDSVEKSPFWFFFICILIQYSPIIFYKKKIGWDTLDAYFPNFLYMVDSFKDLSLPYYNLFSLGGVSFADNFFSGPLLNPIDISLAVLATKLHPLYVFQLQFPIFALLSSYWIYRFLLRFNQNSMYSVLGAITYLYCMLNPTVGQSSFFYAYVLLAFLLDPCYHLIKRKNVFHFLFACVILASLLLKTYFFFIPFFLVLASGAHLYFCKIHKNKFELKFIFCCMIAGGIYFALMKPINSAYVRSTIDLLGDFVSPEPRLRSLTPELIYYSKWADIFADMIDSRLLPGAAWSFMTIILLILFLAQMCLLILNKDKAKFLFILSIGLCLLSAAGVFANFYSQIPYIKSMRWGHAYTNFAQLLYFAFIFMFPISLDSLSRSLREKISIVWLVIYFSVFVYALKHHKSYELYWSAPSLFISYFFAYKKKLFEPVFLIILLVLSFRMNKDFVDGILEYARISSQSSHNSMNKDFVDGIQEYARISSRNSSMKLDQNRRAPAEVGDYRWDDRSWLYDKKATMNGYNITIHPIFWYLKGEPATSSIAIPLCSPKNILLKPRDKYSKNDNLYLKELKSDIIRMVRKNKCSRSIDKFEFTQTSLSFKTVSKVTLVLQNINFFKLDSFESVVEKKMPGGMSLLFHKNKVDLKFSFEKNHAFNFLIFNVISFSLIFLYLITILSTKIFYLRPRAAILK